MPNNDGDWSVVKMLEWATDYFEKKSVSSPRLSIEWLLSHVLGIKRLQLYMQFDRPLTSDELQSLRPLILRRAKHEPLQYITGTTDFYNTLIRVNPTVLIPRPETEQLVEIIAEDHKNSPSVSLLDLGTGSGCIPVALKNQFPHWDIFGLDISPDALKTARSNAELNSCEITFYQADFTKSLPENLQNLNIIVSNPPYVLESEKKSLEKQVRDFEPGIALFTNSLENVYRPLITNSAEKLVPGGCLYLEIHEDHSSEISSFFNSRLWSVNQILDYSGKLRFLKAVMNA